MNRAITSWTSDVHRGRIANCFRRCKIRSRGEAGSSEINFEEDANELEEKIVADVVGSSIEDKGDDDSTPLEP
ncbi:hypothetical protein LINPERHAP2_LOCUS505, partial [Linum perenne]